MELDSFSMDLPFNIISDPFSDTVWKSMSVSVCWTLSALCDTWFAADGFIFLLSTLVLRVLCSVKGFPSWIVFLLPGYLNWIRCHLVQVGSALKWMRSLGSEWIVSRFVAWRGHWGMKLGTGPDQDQADWTARRCSGGYIFTNVSSVSHKTWVPTSYHNWDPHTCPLCVL